jgi:membrane protein YqaA with SNARE-associated domain
MFESYVNFLIYIATTYGYLGAFLTALITSATLFIPIPGQVFTFLLSGYNNPFLIGIISALGSTIGESVGYLVGRGAAEASKTFDKWSQIIEEKLESYGVFFAVLIFAATPLPDDVTGIIAGGMDYDIRKFFLAVFIGKCFIYLAAAYFGSYLFGWLF